MRAQLHVSERRACAALGQHRSTQRKAPRGRDDEERLAADIIELARQYGRYGYRKVAALLRQAGWTINDKRVERIWRREGLKVPHKQPKRGRLWLADGSCIRLRPEQRNHVWSYDFVEDRTHDGRKYRMLNVLDEFTHECLAIRVARKLKAIDVIDVLSDLFILRGVPAHIRSDNGPEFVAKAVQEWIAVVGSKTAYIERGSPWENGYIESFNARLRDELLNGEIFYTLREAQIVIETWRRQYDTRLHASIGYKPPAPEVLVPAFAAWAGCATPTGSAGHAGATANLKLTFHLDHSAGLITRVWPNSGISQRCWKTRHFGSQSRLPSRGSWPSPLASREARTKTACRYRAVPPSACARPRSSSRAGDAMTTEGSITFAGIW